MPGEICQWNFQLILMLWGRLSRAKILIKKIRPKRICERQCWDVNPFPLPTSKHMTVFSIIQDSLVATYYDALDLLLF